MLAAEADKPADVAYFALRAPFYFSCQIAITAMPLRGF